MIVENKVDSALLIASFVGKNYLVFFLWHQLTQTEATNLLNYSRNAENFSEINFCLDKDIFPMEHLMSVACSGALPKNTFCKRTNNSLNNKERNHCFRGLNQK